MLATAVGHWPFHDPSSFFTRLPRQATSAESQFVQQQAFRKQDSQLSSGLELGKLSSLTVNAVAQAASSKAKPANGWFQPCCVCRGLTARCVLPRPGEEYSCCRRCEKKFWVLLYERSKPAAHYPEEPQPTYSKQRVLPLEPAPTVGRPHLSALPSPSPPLPRLPVAQQPPSLRLLIQQDSKDTHSCQDELDRLPAAWLNSLGHEQQQQQPSFPTLPAPPQACSHSSQTAGCPPVPPSPGDPCSSRGDSWLLDQVEVWMAQEEGPPLSSSPTTRQRGEQAAADQGVGPGLRLPSTTDSNWGAHAWVGEGSKALVPSLASLPLGMLPAGHGQAPCLQLAGSSHDLARSSSSSVATAQSMPPPPSLMGCGPAILPLCPDDHQQLQVQRLESNGSGMRAAQLDGSARGQQEQLCTGVGLQPALLNALLQCWDGPGPLSAQPLTSSFSSQANSAVPPSQLRQAVQHQLLQGAAGTGIGSFQGQIARYSVVGRLSSAISCCSSFEPVSLLPHNSGAISGCGSQTLQRCDAKRPPAPPRRQGKRDVSERIQQEADQGASVARKEGMAGRTDRNVRPKLTNNTAACGSGTDVTIAPTDQQTLPQGLPQLPLRPSHVVPAAAGHA
ncbi:hypothetical protein V8C86DRAFT_2886377 [Haematococcus lacustris]